MLGKVHCESSKFTCISLFILFIVKVLLCYWYVINTSNKWTFIYIFNSIGGCEILLVIDNTSLLWIQLFSWVTICLDLVKKNIFMHIWLVSLPKTSVSKPIWYLNFVEHLNSLFIYIYKIGNPQIINPQYYCLFFILSYLMKKSNFWIEKHNLLRLI